MVMLRGYDVEFGGMVDHEIGEASSGYREYPAHVAEYHRPPRLLHRHFQR